MKRGEWLTIGKVVAGGLLLGAGIFFVFQASHRPAKAASSAVQYTAQWTATKLITINTNQLAVSVGAGSGDRIPSSYANFGIGPSEWVVNYCQSTNYPCSGSQIMAEEEWNVATAPADCFSGKGYNSGGGDQAEQAGPCDIGGSHAGTYLYGITDAADDDITNNGLDVYLGQFAGGSVLQDIVPPTSSSLSRVGHTTNARFQGIGAVPETNHGDNTSGWVATGAYGFEGLNTGDNPARSDIIVAGIIMPLQWTVTGTICNGQCQDLAQ